MIHSESTVHVILMVTTDRAAYVSVTHCSPPLQRPHPLVTEHRGLKRSMAEIISDHTHTKRGIVFEFLSNKPRIAWRYWSKIFCNKKRTL